ncbi:MAG: hypothetical protein WKF92_10760 [Pyrinomonadaceae bacterium]
MIRHIQTNYGGLLGICLVAILIVIFRVGSTAQEPTKAVLVDEFGELYCEELLARTDSFISELMKYPDDLGYVNISSTRKRPDSTKRFIRTNAYMRRFDISRLRIVVNSEAENNSAQFWRIPSGASLPKFSEIVDQLSDASKPFLFGHADDLGVCPSFIPTDFVDLIKSNPGSYGKLMVRGNSWMGRKEFAEEYIGRMLSETELSKDRLRVYYIHQPKNYITGIEFWFIPAKKK